MAYFRGFKNGAAAMACAMIALLSEAVEKNSSTAFSVYMTALSQRIPRLCEHITFKQKAIIRRRKRRYKAYK